MSDVQGNEMQENGADLTEDDRRNINPPVDKRFYYNTYGLTVSSQIELPELPAIEQCTDPEIEILTQKVDEELEGATFSGSWLQISDESCQLKLEGISRYRIEKGQRILLDRRIPRDPEKEVVPGDIRLYLLGSALGILLHQRNWLPLHVSALSTPDGVWAFTGHSGAGKSTLGAWLHYSQEWPLVTDDVAVIKPHEELPYLYPGPPRVKLWKDALAALGIDKQGLTRDLTRTDKYHLTLSKGFQRQPQPLKALVMLERGEDGEEATLTKMKGIEAFKIVMATLYRPEVGREFNSSESLLQNISRLAGQIEVYRFRRPWSLKDMNQSIRPLLQRINGEEHE
ncbi:MULTISPECIES: hypothetical protein [Halomonadaceae]|uniref:hypothetical protein n=1 Tax=Halomonadaceae TaxID=28256 RepID=UPI00159B034B|nr:MULTISPECIES: hypothetical protein [Halomonas]QJQ94015.1 hypothetical protein HIO72_01015 [Halomonas sp. PA5]